MLRSQLSERAGPHGDPPAASNTLNAGLEPESFQQLNNNSDCFLGVRSLRSEAWTDKRSAANPPRLFDGRSDLRIGACNDVGENLCEEGAPFRTIDQCSGRQAVSIRGPPPAGRFCCLSGHDACLDQNVQVPANRVHVQPHELGERTGIEWLGCPVKRFEEGTARCVSERTVTPTLVMRCFRSAHSLHNISASSR